MDKLKDQQEDTNFAAKNISRESASMLNLLMEQIKTLVEVSNNLNDRTKEVEKRINELTVDSEKRKEESKIMNEKMDMMEKNMEKFIGLYEVVTNQYNPFLEGENKGQGVEEEEETEESPSLETASQADMVSPSAPVQSASPMPQISEHSGYQNNQQQPQQQPQQYQQPDQQRMQQPEPQQQWSAQNNQPPNQQFYNPNQQPPQQQPQQYQHPDQQPMGASFNYEDRITGEKGFVGNPSQQNGQQGNDMRNFGDPNQYAQGYSQQSQNPFQQPNQQPWNGNGMMNQPQQNTQNQHSPQQDGSLLMPTNKKVSTLQDLLEELAIMDDASFYSMVNNQNNQIATWVMNWLGDLQLGTQLLGCGSRIETIKLISRFMHHNPPQGASQSNDFVFSHGKAVSDLEGMLDEMIYIDDATFASHVNNNKNDIADWLQGSLGLSDLANRIRGLTKKQDVVREIAMYLHSRN